MQDYKPRVFWDDKCAKDGHTGYGDRLIYTYDQPLRLRAIRKALTNAKVLTNNDMKILDIGCGTGDLISEFVKRDVCADIIGIDISNEVIACAKERFATTKKANFYTMEIENMRFPSNSFDLVTSITVLQHIVDKKSFDKAIENVVNVAKPGGHILIMESSPVNIKRKAPNPSSYHMVTLAREEWISVFESKGTRLVSEFCVPQIGMKIIRSANNILKILLLNRKGDIEITVTANNYQSKRALAIPYNLARTILLKLSKPFDYFPVPFNTKGTNLRILIFEKSLY